MFSLSGPCELLFSGWAPRVFYSVYVDLQYDEISLLFTAGSV